MKNLSIILLLLFFGFVSCDDDKKKSSEKAEDTVDFDITQDDGFNGDGGTSDNGGSETKEEDDPGNSLNDEDPGNGNGNDSSEPVNDETPQPDSDPSPTDDENPTDSDPQVQLDSCEPLEPATGNIIKVEPSQAQELQNIVRDAQSGDTILLADGTYNLNGSYLWFSKSNVTLRSEGGNPEAVVLDGSYKTTEIVTVAASDVTIAEITIKRAKTHPIHVTSSDEGDTLNTKIYRVFIEDPAEQAIKINSHSAKIYNADDGEIACCRMKLTDEGRPHINPASGGCYTGGVDAHRAKGWKIRDNHIEGFWCQNGLAEHAIHFWRGGRDTVIERNTLINNARGVGFGLVTSGDARTYDDNPCPGTTENDYVGHYGGIVRNNIIFADRAELFASNAGFDCGVCFWSACGATAVHNTVVSTGSNFSSFEWRFPASKNVVVKNNIATHPLRKRENAAAETGGNLENAALDLFVNISTRDLHLKPTATDAIDKGVAVSSDLCTDDIDMEKRDAAPDIGADEVK